MNVMRKVNALLPLLMAGFLCLPLATPVRAASAQTHAAPPPGVGIAHTLSTITGVAISPLMGVGAVGCYQYFKAKTPAEKAQLPWFAQPVFWVPAFLIVGICFLKDTLGVTFPPGFKKPLDVIETMEHKLAGLVATGAFVPIVVNMIHEANATGSQPAASLATLGFAAIDFHGVAYTALMTPLAMILFFVVFLASNAINILILLSPFPAVDAALKAGRTALLGTVVATAWINPWMGAAWALVLIFAAYLIAGWSFRLSHFGLVFIWDFCTGRKRHFTPDPKENNVFLCRKFQKVPARTYGKLSRNAQDQLVLNYRPWLVLARRTLVLSPGEYLVNRGVFYSEIVRQEGESLKTVILLPPRYLGHEAALAEIYHFAGVRNASFRAAWAWLKRLFTGRITAA